MSSPWVLFLSAADDVRHLVDEAFQREFSLMVLTPREALPPSLPPELRAVVIDGYSELPIRRAIPGVDALLRRIPTLCPRIYLLRDSSPTMEPDRVDLSRSVLYLRGPVSPGRLRISLHRLLGRRERRRRFYLDPRHQIGTHFHLHNRRADETFFRELLEIGPEGMSFLWSREAPPLFPGDRLTRLALVSRGEPFWTSEAQVRHLSTTVDEEGRSTVRVGVEFTGQPEMSPGPLADRDAFEHSHLTDPLLVRTALREMKERQTRAFVQPEGLGEPCEGNISELSRDEIGETLEVTLSEVPMPGVLQPMDIVSGHFVRDNAQLRFCTTVASVEGATLTLRLPKRLERLWARSNLRYTPTGGRRLPVEIFTPLSPHSPAIREVIDLSPDGLSFRADAERDLLLPGMRLRQVCLVLGEGPPVRASAEIRHLGATPDDEGMVPCGIKFLSMDRPTQHQLVDYLIAKSFPQVDDATELDDEALWAFLVHTNYLSPSKRAAQLFPEVQIRATHSHLLATPKHLSRTLVFRGDDDLSGTVSITRIYSQTWMVHHLAASLRVSALVPKNLLLYLGEYISKTPDIEYVRMMWRPANNWSNRMLGRLIHRLHNQDQSVVKQYNYLDLPTATPLEAGDPLGWRVRPMEPGEEIELEIHFINNREYFMMKAEDLHRVDPRLSGLDQQYGMAQLRRGREILVAERRGVIGGFCLMEHGSPGFNHSNLLHGFRTLITEKGRPEADVVSAQLIRGAVRFYGELGQSKAVAMVEDADRARYEAVGFTWRKEYISWTFGQDIASFYNLYCHYIFRVYERLERRLLARQRRLRSAPSPEALQAAEDALASQLAGAARILHL